MLKIWNTLHRTVEEFQSIHDDEVGLYTCGPTVYNPVHLGNFRSYLFEDILKRTLKLLGYRVKHAMNITDVGHLAGDVDEGEEKMQREATRQGKTAWEIAKQYEQQFLIDLERLNLVRPEIMPHATEHITEQIDLIKALEKKGFTYQTSDGIYFDTAKFPEYGKLSGQKLEEKKAGARVAVNSEKRQSTDFALWKFSPKGKKRDMEWESPWGTGFPGWHIECSAMSVKYLGQPFDIHCGGIDNLPIHHENEIAQTEAATNQPLAHYWVHGEFLLINSGRMGKSEGNAYTVGDLIAKKFDPLAFRYLCLGTHYRQKLNFTWEGLEGASQALKKLQSTTRRIKYHVSRIELNTQYPILNTFTLALEDDLNTPQALAIMWDMLKSDLSDEEKGGTLVKMDEVLGLGLASIIGQAIEVPPNIMKLAEERSRARGAKDWKKSDELREQIEAAVWRIEDKNRGEFDLTPLH